MKFLQLLLFAALFLNSFNPVQAQNSIQVNLKFSKFYAVYAYLQDLSDYSGDNAYKLDYKASEFNNAENNALIGQFNTLDIYHSYEFNAFPIGDKSLVMISSMLSKNLMVSESLEEFKNRSFGVLPTEDLTVFTNTVEHFIPIYDALVYNVHKDDFEVKLNELKTYVDSIDISQFFLKSLTFYGTTWDPEVPFYIVIIPSTKKGGFTAEAFFNNAVSEVPMDFPYYDILFSVLLHEIDHVLYNEQSLKTKENLNDWFTSNPSENRRYAYLILNEALATALGNGYAYEEINGSLDKEDWYNMKYINLIAKEIYPLVREYLDADKSIDKEFVDRYIAIYDEHFPEWSSEMENLFTYRYIVADDEDSESFFARNYRYASKRYLEQPFNQSALEGMMETPVTKIVIVSQDHKAKWKMLKSTVPELSEMKVKLKKEFMSTVRLSDGTIMLVVNVIETPVDEFLSKICASGRVNAGTTMEY